MKSRKAEKIDRFGLLADELGSMMIQLLQDRRALHRLTAALAARTVNRRSLARNCRDELLREKTVLLKQLRRQAKALAEMPALDALRPDKEEDIRIVEDAIRRIRGTRPAALLRAMRDGARSRLADDNFSLSVRLAEGLGFQYAGLTERGEAEIRRLMAS